MNDVMVQAQIGIIFSLFLTTQTQSQLLAHRDTLHNLMSAPPEYFAVTGIGPEELRAVIMVMLLTVEEVIDK
jgi:hypothetical protein